MKKGFMLVVCFLLAAAMLVGCSGGSGDNPAAESPATSESAAVSQPAEASQSAGEQSAAPAASGDIVVGFSTGSSGASWRNIMINNFTEVAEEYKADGRIKDYQIVNNVTDGDTSEQANIIRDFINDPAVNVIIVNPNSTTELNGVLSEAVAAGKRVVVCDSEIDVDGVVCISIDHYAWAHKNFTALCEQIQEGNVIYIYGLEGHPANTLRMQAMQDVVAEYPNINVVAQATGGWDQQMAKEATLQILGSGQKVDAVLNDDSMGAGILEAFLDMDMVPKVMFGDGGTAFFKQWKDLLDNGSDFWAYTQPNPPGIAASALRLAVNLADGKEFKDGVLGGQFDNAVYYECRYEFDNSNFEEGWEMLKDQPDDYCLTEWYSEEDAEALFK